MPHDKKRPDDIARLDAANYREPGRDLLATKPAHDAPGDIANPTATEHTHGTSGDPGIGSDERPRLADAHYRKGRWKT